MWDGANFAWNLGQEPVLKEEQDMIQADRGIVIMIYDKDHLSAPEVSPLEYLSY